MLYYEDVVKNRTVSHTICAWLIPTSSSIYMPIIKNKGLLMVNLFSEINGRSGVSKGSSNEFKESSGEDS